jgi:hypothetical protein
VTLIFPTSNPPEGFESGDLAAWTGTEGTAPTVQAQLSIMEPTLRKQTHWQIREMPLTFIKR